MSTSCAPGLYIGLMSGTSLDGVDGVLAEISEQKCTVALYQSVPIAPELRAELLALNSPGPNELHRAALAGNALALAYAGVVQALLAESGLVPGAVRAIGAHGQTVRHRPQEFGGTGYTLQLNNPALLAERTGITVVADFRSRDLAAGGQGAPLVPAFHQRVIGLPGRTRAVLNIGGIANLSVLQAGGGVLGFDCGPGNALMDAWCQRHTGQAYDDGGAFAASGRVAAPLLSALRAEPYFAQPPPKSTGRDLFHREWLEAHLARHAALAPRDVQATLTELTASACADCVNSYGSDSDLLAVCGGGARNTFLMARLQALLPTTRVTTTDALGLPAQQVEAAAFAWLAHQAIAGLPGNLPKATGAQGARVLGGIYPA